MPRLLLFLLLYIPAANGQTIEACRQRYNTYLNFHGNLGGKVRFQDKVIYINNGAGKPALAFYEEELPAMNVFFQNASLKEQQIFISKKGVKKLTRSELDSLLSRARKNEAGQVEGKKLAGYRIALDPGHFATTLQEAKFEQKYLYFPSTKLGGLGDSVKLFESSLTFNTAQILKQMLEDQGADVMLTRDLGNHTSFNCTFTEFLSRHKTRHLDSLVASGSMAAARAQSLKKASTYDFFWNFFRDYDLANRSEKINAYRPHVTLIIHYNVDEKNVPWTSHTKKNFTMAFIGGAFTADNLGRTEGKLNFMRLLLTDQLNRSQILADKTVQNFHSTLEIPIAKASDATYLASNCLATSSPGVFCRNLALCRKINSPLVYGESLYQDNEEESARLMKSDVDLYGLKTNERLQKVARSYFEGLMAFLESEKSAK